MEKDFDRWNKLKKAINASEESDRVFFHEGDIWWARVGVNVGYEIDGKHKQFARPVIVLKKYNQYSFLALPLSTATRTNRWRVPIGDVAGNGGALDLSRDAFGERGIEIAHGNPRALRCEPACGRGAQS